MVTRVSRGVLVFVLTALVGVFSFAQSAVLAEIVTERVTFRLTGIEFRAGDSEGMTLAVFYGEFGTPSTRECVHGRDFRLLLDDTEYEPDTGKMSDIQRSISPRRDYPGNVWGQCVNRFAPTYLVFNVPSAGERVALRLDDEQIEIEIDWAAGAAAPATLTPTSSPTARPSLTPLPTSTRGATSTPRATFTPRPTSTPQIDGETYTAYGMARVRSCTSTTCEIVETLGAGDFVTVTGQDSGATVSGSTLWYAVVLADGRRGYVHSSLLGEGVITISQPPVSTSSGAGAPAGFVCPRNCDAARAMGLTEAQAGTCSNLDRDKDGKACYGD